MTYSREQRRSETGVTLIEILVVLALFAIVAGAAILSVPSRQASTESDLELLTLQYRLDAAIDQALSGGKSFGIWQNNEDIVLLHLVDDEKWEPSPDTRQNSPKLFARYARITFHVDEDKVFAVSPALAPQSGRALRIEVTDGADLSFDGLRLMQIGEDNKRNATQDR